MVTMGSTSRAEHRFFLGFALAATFVLLLGFLPSYLAPLAGRAGPLARLPLPLVVHIHGVVFFAYLALYLVQSWLAASGRIAWHRRLGAALGWPMLAALLLVGVAISIWGPDRLRGQPEDIAFIAWLAGDLLMIALFMGGALLFRRDSGFHKRWMALAMAVMTGPGLGRVMDIWLVAPAMSGLWFPPLAFGSAILFFDLKVRGHVHPATAWGLPLLLMSMVVRLVAMHQAGWVPVADTALKAVQAL